MDVYDPYLGDQAKIQQQMRVAEMLQRQGMQSPQGQMVSGHYVRSSPTQYAARLAASLMGKRGMDESTGALGDLTARASADRQAEIAAALGGGDPAQRLQAALTANSPGARAIGTNMIRQQNALQEAQYEAQLREAEAIRRANEAKTLQEQRDAAAMARAQLSADAHKAAGGAANTPYFTPVYGADGAYAFNNRTGQVEPLAGPDGAPIVRSTDDPSLQGALTGARKTGEMTAEAATQAQLDYPKMDAQGQYAEELINGLLSHPGLSASVGVPGVTKYLPGTEAQGFMARLKQIEGQQFLQAFESLKGGGAITAIEGEKATAAMARLNTAQSEKEFKGALTELQGVIKNLRDRAKRKAGMAGAGGAAPQGDQTAAPTRLKFNPATGEFE